MKVPRSKANCGIILKTYKGYHANYVILKGYGNIFFIGLLPRTIEISPKSVVRILVACLVSELLSDKEYSYPPSCFIIRSIFMTHKQGGMSKTCCQLFKSP